jgi:hypothetical protein
MEARATICCTIQLGSISSLRCQKSRTSLPIQTSGCETMFSRTIWSRRSGLSPSSPSATPGTLCLSVPRGRATRSPKGEAWWSLSGSNRRPHACKARALPAELRPHDRKDERLREIRRDDWPSARREGWWAWEDLNFRPHAYQARALTN